MTRDNALKRVTHISTYPVVMHEVQEYECDNPLKRVTHISTVSFQTPLKSRLSRLIFVGIYLNILIITFFSPFFCLFKNCTKINTIQYIYPPCLYFSIILIFATRAKYFLTDFYCLYNRVKPPLYFIIQLRSYLSERIPYFFWISLKIPLQAS